MVVEAFTYVVHPAMYKPEWTKRAMPVFVEIEWDGTRLSITGVEGPLPSGNARGSCGQIDGHWDDAYFDELTYEPGWDRRKMKELARVWAKWHLNDMRPGCEHQMAAGWQDRLIDPDKPKTQSNMLAWKYPSEHPDGLLTRPCPECGYKYGTAWMTEAVPDQVLDWLRNLPRTTKQPAWT